MTDTRSTNGQTRDLEAELDRLKEPGQADMVVWQPQVVVPPKMPPLEFPAIDYSETPLDKSSERYSREDEAWKFKWMPLYALGVWNKARKNTGVWDWKGLAFVTGLEAVRDTVYCSAAAAAAGAIYGGVKAAAWLFW